MRRGNRNRSTGIVTVWTVIMLAVLLLLIGFAIDVGYRFLIGQQLQNAADAAALSGAAHVRFNQTVAVNNAVAFGGANPEGNGTVLFATADVTTGHYDRSTGSFTAGAPFDAVQVYARRENGLAGRRGPLPLFFLPALGTVFGRDMSTAYVQRKAIAMSGGTFSAGIVVLDPTKQGALTTKGTVNLNIPGGGIQVNSSDPSAAAVVKGTSGTFNMTEFRINGGLDTSGNPGLPAKTYTNTTPVPDPLASVVAPVKTDYVNRGSINLSSGSLTAQPGYYPGGITLDKTGTLTLTAGVYLLGPPGLNVKGGTLIANQVMFYLTTGTDPSKFGNINLDGNSMTVTPPTSGAYTGILVFMDRSAPSSITLVFGGNGGLTMSGTLYTPSVGVELHGNPTVSSPSQVICNTLDLRGNSTINIAYDGRNPVTINNVFLVE